MPFYRDIKVSRNRWGGSRNATPGTRRPFQFAACISSPGFPATTLNPERDDDEKNFNCHGVLSGDSCTSWTQEFRDQYPLRNTTELPRAVDENKPRPTPTEYLSKALRNTGHPLGNNDQLTRVVDPSFVNLDRPASKLLLSRQQGPRSTAGRPGRLCLQTILGEYLRLVDSCLSHTGNTNHADGLDIALNEVFRPDNYNYLKIRGYEVADVAAWAWVLKSQNSHQATLRLFMLEADYRAQHGTDAPGVPPFIPLFLLKQQRLSAHTFRLLLIYSLHLISGKSLPAVTSLVGGDRIRIDPIPENFHPKIDPTTGMTFVVRLIRHARLVWPRALLTIARAFARFLTTPNTDKSATVLRAQRADRFRTEKFNSCLWLLSLPTNIAPFRSTSIQQQAQFELLRAMAAYQPVLPVTRKGYRAVVAIQLAHKKTADERQSAELKAPSWPPWKEAKLGIDAQRGNEGMVSRAMHVLSQMREAGYSHQVWEEISAILAGWDTDRSPTVQTRTLVRRPQYVSFARRHDPNNYTIWVARIRATRTVREAWACFLSYQDHNLPPKGAIYAAMAEKLIYRRKAIQSGFDRTSHALPGDSPEVHPEPASARDLIYVHTEPPTLEEFLEQMLSKGFRPSRRFLALLFQSAPSLQAGLHYLRCSDLTEDQVTLLSTVWSQPHEYETPNIAPLLALPDFVFASFIRFLCVHSGLSGSTATARDTLTTDRFPVIMADRALNGPKTTLFALGEEESGTQHPRALWHAIQLTRLRPACTPAWTHILSALTRERLSKPYRQRNRSFQRIIIWHEILQVLSWMREHDVELGMEGFVPSAAIKHPEAVAESVRILQRATSHNPVMKTDGDDHFDAMVRTALHVLKGQFDHLVLPASRTSGLAERSIFTVDDATDSAICVPTLLHAPSPAMLHAFVRALGTVGDDDGLMHLLHWMSQSAAQLQETAEEHLNGERLMRRTLVAIRVFLERLQRRSVDGARVPSGSIQEAYDLVSRTPWEWPSDAEVEEYQQ
ncbi:hypothetical protein NUU61_004753 [Penicillium alfredii]|uniref:Uncharacterized protein n=1 Tax=Penicillium alfredii TaxID=1506179 RepID=A0A9W9F882_9EURO|nr:uncharacterized protein NUU61_004753 [Penicillium alfredii]KAJ5095397.1 hypothetical protein NUU61_004753 [Penicillium alfredii]